MVSVSGFLIGSPASNKMPLPPQAGLAPWYHGPERHAVTRCARDDALAQEHDFTASATLTICPTLPCREYHPSPPSPPPPLQLPCVRQAYLSPVQLDSF